MPKITRTRLAREDWRLRAWSARRARELFDPRPHEYEGCSRPVVDDDTGAAAPTAVPLEQWAAGVTYGHVLPWRSMRR